MHGHTNAKFDHSLPPIVKVKVSRKGFHSRQRNRRRYVTTGKKNWTKFVLDWIKLQ